MGKTIHGGVCVLIKANVQHTIHSTVMDQDGRFIILDIEIHDVRMTLANLYAPSQDDPHFFQHLINEIECIPNDNRIIGEDFNLVLNIEKDKCGRKTETHKRSNEMIKAWMEETELVDIWRHQSPEKLLFTWRGKRPNLVFSRIDFFLISVGFVSMSESKITPGYRTDHSTIELGLQITSNKRGKGFWKLNISLLRNIDYLANVKAEINEIVVHNNEANPHTLWEVIKLQIRGVSISFSAKLKRERNETLKNAEMKLRKLEEKLITSVDKTQIEHEIDLVKTDIEEIINYQTLGAIIRSKTKLYEEREKNTRYFLNMEKRNYNKKVIKRLRLQNGTLITDREEILFEQRDFYRKLYSTNKNKNSITLKEFMNDKKLPKLNEEDKKSIEHKITEQEICSMIKTFANDKSPGLDGIPIEFYKVLWNDIKTYFINVVNCSYELKYLSPSQRRGVISLLPKDNKDILMLKNWRPITLLNADYKILAKCIACRIKKHIQKLMHDDQTGFLKGRYIGENINRLLGTMEIIDEENIPAILINIDFEKAFDYLERDFISTALNEYNFGPYITTWVKILYNNIESSVINNGYISGAFPVSRGVRQGCPLSPYLFILCAEIMATVIRNEKHIQGISINNIQNKIMMYADDTNIITTCNEMDLRTVIEVFEKFYHLSGLKMNLNKTTILRLGALKGSDIKIAPDINVKWTNEPIKMLGVNISANRNEIANLNFPDKVSKIETILNIWRERNFTIFGKVTIIKSLAFSQLVYLLSVLPSPQQGTLKYLESVLFQYIWDGKPDKIKRSTMCFPPDEGGFKMIV